MIVKRMTATIATPPAIHTQAGRRRHHGPASACDSTGRGAIAAFPGARTAIGRGGAGRGERTPADAARFAGRAFAALANAGGRFACAAAGAAPALGLDADSARRNSASAAAKALIEA